MTLSERFFDHVGKFRRTATKVVHNIIDELHQPLHARTYRPGSNIKEEHAIFLDMENIGISGEHSKNVSAYFEKNIIIKITHQGDQIYEDPPIQELGLSKASNLGTSMNNSQFVATTHNNNQNSDAFQNLKWKQYGREFHSLDIMFEVLYLLSKPESDYKLRVPVSALIDYKGFRALASGNIPIQP
mmetsp:Transcript_39106/g.37432  ORF Transcript_39106/g.37432 Transcript_39106/m.37432 type:complete len:186 (-) Transcript_39106:37-594(-)